MLAIGCELCTLWINMLIRQLVLLVLPYMQLYYWGGSLFTSCTIQCGILLGSALKVKLITLHLLSKLLSTMMKKIVAKDNVHKVKPKKI